LSVLVHTIFESCKLTFNAIHKLFFKVVKIFLTRFGLQKGI